MEPAAPPVACVTCGQEVPREEAFGLPPDLRCETCAMDLRERNHPARMRRPFAAAARGRPGDRVTATASVLAVAVVLFLAVRSGAELGQHVFAFLAPLPDGIRPWHLM